MEWTVIGSLAAAFVAGVGSIIVAVVKTAGATRDQIDKVKGQLGAQMDSMRDDLGGVKTAIAEVRGQMNTVAAQSVPQEHCRGRHERIAADMARLRGDLQETRGRLMVLSDPPSGKHQIVR